MRTSLLQHLKSDKSEEGKAISLYKKRKKQYPELRSMYDEMQLDEEDHSEKLGEVLMPYDQVMHKFKKGMLHSGSSKGPKVKNRKQAIAIMMHEKKEAKAGKEEYQPEGKEKENKKKKKGHVSTGPSSKIMKKYFSS